MLGQDTHATESEQRPDADRLVETCRDVRERLEAIARALASLCAEIDRALDRGSALPEPSRNAPTPD
jgi:hypothetical protein